MGAKMNIVSYTFLAFLIISIILYYIVPQKIQWMVLLASSVVFYAFSGMDNLAIVALTTVIVYIFSCLMQKNLDRQAELLEGADRKQARTVKTQMKSKRKKWLVLSLVAVISILAFLKYYNFAVKNLNALLGLLSLNDIRGLELINPLGISFYSFMMISYLIDIYNGRISAQRNFAKYAAYVLYFPHVTQGPIARYESVAPQIYASRRFDYDAVIKGIWLMLWGYFKKLVIADRLALFVNEVFDEYRQYAGMIFILAGVAYSIQIYCDFSGCMDIVRGASECFGIKLGENFERPYFSQTLPEFWRRWHISLGSFFREYVFYPVSTSKLFLKANSAARKHLGNEAGRNLASCIPIMCVWLLTGIWHGARWNFIAWGLFHGVLICLSTIFEQPIEGLTKKLHIKRDCLSWSIFRMLRTFFLCVIGRIIFLGNGVRASLHMIKSAFTDWGVFYNLERIGLSHNEWLVVAAGCIVLLAVSIAQEYRKSKGYDTTIRDWLSRQNLWLRWTVLFAGIMAILALGVYGSGAGAVFIYEQF